MYGVMEEIQHREIEPLRNPLHQAELKLYRKTTTAAGDISKTQADKLKLLIVADAPEEVSSLKMSLKQSELIIDPVVNPAKLEAALNRTHDIVIVDIQPQNLESVLKRLRENQRHSNIPVLVSKTRIIVNDNLAGVLPRYRAMPCSPTELITLANRQLTFSHRDNSLL